MTHILLIDDHPTVGIIIKTYLTALGWPPNTLDIYESVDKAVTGIEKCPPYSAILLDHSVPPTFNFRESLEILSSAIKETPVILFTGLLPADFGNHKIDKRICSVLEKDDLSPTALQLALSKAGL